MPMRQMQADALLQPRVMKELIAEGWRAHQTLSTAVPIRAGPVLVRGPLEESRQVP